METSTEKVKFRHQAWISKSVVRAFQEECKERKWGPADLLQFILEERYESKDD